MTPHSALDVLIVEDNDADAFTIEKCLSELETVRRVRRAHDGLQALELLRGKTYFPALILLDLNMPHRDGFEFITGYRMSFDRRAKTERAVVAVLTTSSRGYDFHKAILRRADAFITKPSSYGELSQIVAELCDTVARGETPPQTIRAAA